MLEGPWYCTDIVFKWARKECVGASRGGSFSLENKCTYMSDVGMLNTACRAQYYTAVLTKQQQTPTGLKGCSVRLCSATPVGGLHVSGRGRRRGSISKLQGSAQPADFLYVVEISASLSIYILSY